MTTTTTPFPLTVPVDPDAAAQFEQLTSDWDVALGVRVSYIGEDGDMIVLGHHDDRRVIAALSSYTRSFTGEKLADSYTEAEDLLIQRWARFLTECDDPAVHAQEVADEGRCSTCTEIKDVGWWMTFGAKPDDVRAFPVTHWSV